MAEQTKIAWATSTFNAWIGCTKVGPGCDHCYAEQLDRTRFSKTLGGATKAKPIIHWGVGAPRYLTSKGLWDDPLKWNKKREIAMGLWAAGRGERVPAHRVFCNSLADVFDNEVDPRWRERLWGLINATPYLEWLLLTKRIGNVSKMLPENWIQTRDGMGLARRNVRLMISVVNQEEADRDIPKLLALPFKNGISYEPALGPVDWTRLSLQPGVTFNGFESSHNWIPGRAKSGDWRGIQWIIVGGESTQGAGKARPFELEWARDAIAQGKAAGVPVFLKQLGSCWYGLGCKDRAGANPVEWPEDLRVQEFPS